MKEFILLYIGRGKHDEQWIMRDYLVVVDMTHVGRSVPHYMTDHRISVISGDKLSLTFMVTISIMADGLSLIVNMASTDGDKLITLNRPPLRRYSGQN